MAHELSAGMPVLALYSGKVENPEGEEEDEVWYTARVVQRLTPEECEARTKSLAQALEVAGARDALGEVHQSIGVPEIECEWDEGHERFFASCIELRTFLSHVPLKLRTERPAPKPKRKAFRAEKYIDDDAALAAALAAEEAELRDETVAADLLRRSGRDAHKTDPSDTKLLREAVAELRRVWNGKEPKGEWRLDQNASGVGGLLICSNFLSADEVEALRTVYGAHRAWGHYAYGSTGRHNELASVVQRIDFGPRQMRAEGIVSGSPMWRLGSVRQEMLSLIEERLRYVCSAAGLWQATRPDTLQLTKIGCAQKLDNHWDRRDRWQEGIASIAWSELPCEGDVRGESWILVMEKGSRKELQSVQVEMQPGSAYVLTGVAQGTTKVCERG